MTTYAITRWITHGGNSRRMYAYIRPDSTLRWSPNRSQATSFLSQSHALRAIDLYNLTDTEIVPAAPLTESQRAALAAFRDANGRDWKSKLGAIWTNGNYSRFGVGMDQAALLQQVRNELGPEWLHSVTRSDLESNSLQPQKESE